MKKSAKKILTMLITCILLTGCNETEEDFKNAKNPEEYIINNFKNFYKKDIKVKNNTKQKDSNKEEVNLIEFYLSEEESFTFDACSYWQKSSVLPTRHYTSVNNYESKYSTKILTKYLTEEYGILSNEPKEIEYNEICKLKRDILTLELNDIKNIDKLATTLEEIGEEKETYALHLKVKYQDKKTDITINDESKKEDYLQILSKLTEEETN